MRSVFRGGIAGPRSRFGTPDQGLDAAFAAEDRRSGVGIR